MAEQHVTQRQAAGEGRAESTRNVPVYTPPADIYETDDALVLLMDMPGVGPDGVNVILENRVLTITGRGALNPPEGYGLALAEYQQGDYERAFTLSEIIDRDSIEAIVKDGVLKLVLPKVKPAPAKTIAVKRG